MEIDTQDPRPIAQPTMTPEEERAKEYDFFWYAVVSSTQFWEVLQQEARAWRASGLVRETCQQPH